MARRLGSSAARKSFAEPENAVLLAVKWQAALALAALRRTCGCLIMAVESCLGRLHRLRRRLA
jgi:hypothetical protein